MAAIIILAIIGVWIVLSALLLISLCMASSRFNQEVEETCSEETYEEHDRKTTPIGRRVKANMKGNA